VISIRPTHWRTVLPTSITAAVYVGLFAATNLAIRSRSPGTLQAWLDWASTDLVNLGSHPVGSLVLSAFVDDGDILAWVALALTGLVAAGHTLGSVRCALVVTIAHVVGTLVSEGVLAVWVADGAAPDSERTTLDVGPSYIVVAALVVGITYGRWPARILSGIAFAVLAPHLFRGLSDLDVAPVGHCCVIVVALLTGNFLHRSWRRRTVPAAAD